MEGDRYPHKLFRHIWNIKPHRGSQRKSWSRVVDDLFSSLGLNKAEWVEGGMFIERFSVCCRGEYRSAEYR